MKTRIIIIAVALITVVACKQAKEDNILAIQRHIIKLENPLDSLLSQFMNDENHSAQYCIYIYQSSKGMVITFIPSDKLSNSDFQPLLVGEKKGKQLNFYTGIESLIKSDTTLIEHVKYSKKYPYNSNGRSYVVYFFDNKVKLIKGRAIPPFLPPPDSIIEIK